MSLGEQLLIALSDLRVKLSKENDPRKRSFIRSMIRDYEKRLKKLNGSSSTS